MVSQPVYGVNKLDRMYVSEPIYTSLTFVRSTGMSGHKAVLAYIGLPTKTTKKTKK